MGGNKDGVANRMMESEKGVAQHYVFTTSSRSRELWHSFGKQCQARQGTVRKTAVALPVRRDQESVVLCGLNYL